MKNQKIGIHHKKWINVTEDESIKEYTVTYLQICKTEELPPSQMKCVNYCDIIQ